MDSNPASWARKNKNKLIKEYFRKQDFKGSKPPVAIFMAGIPGAGKTEFTKELLKSLDENPLRIDMDEIAEDIEGYKAHVAYAFRAAATIILERVFDTALKKKIDFIFDGTFGSAKAIANVRRSLSRGYKVKVYYIYQNPKTAWSFTKAREIVEHRSIDREGFIDSYFSIRENIMVLQEEYSDVIISLIIKGENNFVGSRLEDVKDVFKQLPESYTKDALESDIIE